jgi:hypothetical protein
MMQFDLIILRQGTAERIDAWRYATDQDREFFITLDENKNRLLPEEVWRELALRINQSTCNGSALRLDVIMFLRGNLFENLCDESRLMEIVDSARNHTWGANLYIAWDKAGAKFQSLFQEQKSVLVLEKWFRKLLQSGVTDLIEISDGIRLRQPNEDKRIRDSALESENRRGRLCKLVGQDGWGLTLRDSVYFLKDFIDRVEVSPLAGEDKNLAVFYDQRPPGGWKQLLERSSIFKRSGNWFIGALARSNVRDLEDLEGLWEQAAHEAKPVEFRGIFQFAGVFEWLYALLRLREACRTPPPSQTAQQHNDIVEVEHSSNLLFKQEPNKSELRLLITTTFCLTQKREPGAFDGNDSDFIRRREAHCIAAANEIGRVLRGLSFHVVVEVHQGITCETLPPLIAKSFTAWLHVGHGDSEQGLYEEQTRQFASPERWRDCFIDYEGSLQLVVFSVCESTAIAKLFAEAGVGIAIGFENEVLTKATREHSAEVIPAAMQIGDRTNAILDCFRQAVDALRSRSYREDRHDRYYSDARPKAFIAKSKS